MQTPALIEALFQLDARKEALHVCSLWKGLEGGYDACMLRQYPQALSPDGELILRVVAGVLLLAAMFGFVRSVQQASGLRRKGAVLTGGNALRWALHATAQSMWAAWKGLMVLAFFVLLVQIVLA